MPRKEHAGTTQFWRKAKQHNIPKKPQRFLRYIIKKDDLENLIIMEQKAGKKDR